MRTLPLLLLLAAASLSSAADWTRDSPSPPSPNWRVDSNDASVHVWAGASTAIEVRVVAEGWKIGSDEVRVTDTRSAIASTSTCGSPRATGASAAARWRGSARPPRDVVAIHTADGSIALDGLEGRCRLVTGDGSITVETLDGSLDAKSGDGPHRGARPLRSA